MSHFTKYDVELQAKVKVRGSVMKSMRVRLSFLNMTLDILVLGIIPNTKKNKRDVLGQ
jgi:hypothetical protein